MWLVIESAGLEPLPWPDLPPGFSEERVDSPEALRAVLEYIAQNPVKSRTGEAAEGIPVLVPAFGQEEAWQGLL